MFSFPLPSSTHADVAEHAVAVLNALQGDWREALCHMDLRRNFGCTGSESRELLTKPPASSNP
jgi:hypothetical protein